MVRATTFRPRILSLISRRWLAPDSQTEQPCGECYKPNTDVARRATEVAIGRVWAPKAVRAGRRAIFLFASAGRRKEVSSPPPSRPEAYAVHTTPRKLFAK